MIKPLNSQLDEFQTPQLSAAKPRGGLQSISELLPRLIRSYELQAEAARRRERAAKAADNSPRQPVTSVVCVPNEHLVQQTTFGWFE